MKWNLGIMLIRFGYFIRKYQQKPQKFNIRWKIGVFLLIVGYYFRGNIPQKIWKYNHI